MSSFSKYVGNGAQTVFTVNQPMPSYSTLEVSLDGVVSTTGFTYNRTNATVTFAVAPADEVVIKLSRVTQVEPIHKFATGAAFTAKSVDTNFAQESYRVEELQDAVLGVKELEESVLQAAEMVQDALDTLASDYVLVGTLADILSAPESVIQAMMNGSGVALTSAFSSDTGSGGAMYRITTLANERVARDNSAWVPDGEDCEGRKIGFDHYLEAGDGLTYVAVYVPSGPIQDKQCGVIGKKIGGVVVDDGPALNKLFSYAKTGAAAGASMSGGHRVNITPRSVFYISETVNIIDYYVPVSWGGSELRPSTPITAIKYEANGSEMADLQIWYNHLDKNSVLQAQQPAFHLSAGQPVAITSESAFTKLKRIWIFNAYRGFYLYSQGSAGGLIWQFEFDNCYTNSTLDYGFYLWSIAQVSTTTKFNKCHTKNVNRDIVKHNSKNYAALQHMLPTTVVEPGVTSGWQAYWLELTTYSDARPAWASGTFYSTCGKAYFGRNVQTVTFDDSSADGGVNFEEGNVMNFFNSGVTVNSFHLEGTNLNFANRCPIIIDADCSWDYLYMYDLRVQLPLETDECALIGGTLGRGRFLTLQGTRNHTQNATRVGQFRYVRAARGAVVDFANISVGAGVDPDYVTQKEMCQSFTSARWNSRVSDLMFTMSTAGDYVKVYETVVPNTGSPTAVYQEFSDLLEITANCGNTAIASQQVGKYAKVRVSVFVQSGAGAERSVYDVSAVSGDAGFIYQTFDSVTRKFALWVKCSNPGQLGVASFSGRDGGYDSNNGKSRMLYSAVAGAAASVQAMAGFSEVQGASMSGLPQLAPDLTFVESRASSYSPAKALSITASSAAYSTLLSVSTTSSKGLVSLLSLVSPTAVNYYVRLTVDGVKIWDSTSVAFASGTVTPLIGAFSKSTQNTLTESGYAFNSSFLLEVKAASGAPTLACDYLVRPIK